MASVAYEDDSRFDEAESDVDRGEPWLYREDGAPNPLTIRVTGWSTGHTKLGDAEFMAGIDRNGKAWSVLVGSVVLTKRLIDGLVEKWSDELNGFVIAETLGRVQVGEVVSLKYLGDGENAQGKAYPRFMVSRKPPAEAAGGAATTGDDIPFAPSVL